MEGMKSGCFAICKPVILDNSRIYDISLYHHFGKAPSDKISTFTLAFMSYEVSLGFHFKVFQQHFLCQVEAAPLGIPLTNFGFACRVERLDLQEKLTADQINELVELFERPHVA